jgi:hypothetical protein
MIAYATGSSKLVNGAIINGTTITLPTNPYARIKTVQTTPDVPLMDVLVDNLVTFSNVPYQASSSYTTVNSGTHGFKAQATAAPGTFLANTNLTLGGGAAGRGPVKRLDWPERCIAEEQTDRSRDCQPANAGRTSANGAGHYPRRSRSAEVSERGSAGAPILNTQHSRSTGDISMSPASSRGGAPESGGGARLSGSALFKLLWDALVDLLGTSATAAILGRASRRAQARAPELGALIFRRVDREFGYTLPASFERSDGPPAALRALLDELRPLLVELTGPVGLRRLEQVPQLRAWVAPVP